MTGKVVGWCFEWGEGITFPVTWIWNLVLCYDGEPYHPTRGTRHPALLGKQAAQYTISLGRVNHSPLAQNRLHGINTFNGRCTAAVYSPVEDWDSTKPVCKLRKQSVRALIRGQDVSWAPNTEPALKYIFFTISFNSQQFNSRFYFLCVLFCQGRENPVFLSLLS